MRGLAALAALLIIVSCGGKVDVKPVPPKPGIETKGIQYDLVDGATTYTAYCDRSVIVTKTAPVVVALTSPTLYFANVSFPEDGLWYCGMTAKSSDTDESELSPVILGVNKVGGEFFRP